MKLSRSEVVTMYNSFKDTNLLGMSTKCKKAFIVNAIKLKPISDKIIEENTSVSEKLKTVEYDDAAKKYFKAKADNDANKTEETSKALIDALKEFEPLFRDMESKINDAISALDQEFEVSLVDIPMNDFLEYLEKAGIDFSFNSILIFQNLLK